MAMTRRYGDGEAPRVGDVVRLFEGAYGSGVVTALPEDPSEADVAIVERVHASVGHGQIQIGVERVAVSYARLRNLPVFVTGSRGEIDNRDRS